MIAGMHSRSPLLPQTVANDEVDAEAELGFLSDVLRLLPSGVTVQDEAGRFVLMNDAAAAQLGICDVPPFAAPSPELERRRETGVALLREGRGLIAEEAAANSDGPTDPPHGASTGHDFRPLRSCFRAPLDISDQKRFEDELFRAAYYDELTGLPSRRVLEHRVNGLLASRGAEQRFALAFLDVDNFKQINDYYGHAIGDALLVELARRLQRELRESDMLSRISGDEFLLMLHPVQGIDEVAEFIHDVQRRLSAPFFVDGSEVFTSTSIGVSLHPDHGRSYDVLCQNADLAMYRVKDDGKGATAFFDQAMEREAQARMKIEQSLRLAILEKRFCCAFQAKVDIRTKDVVGIEALVRLRDHEGVIQAPGSFINLAVELGLIDELTHLVLAEIVKSIDLINATFGSKTTISINVAAKQAGDPDFMRRFALALRETGFPKRFMVEVTEDAFVAKLASRRDPADPARSRRRHFDRRFRDRVFLIVGTRRHHGRRDQDRSLVHHGHSHAAAQPGYPARDRNPSARR